MVRIAEITQAPFNEAIIMRCDAMQAVFFSEMLKYNIKLFTKTITTCSIHNVDIHLANDIDGSCFFAT